jgi:vacuolar protein sorting-associated protein VTA1
MRIARALKAGQDPNASNPVQEQTASPSGPPLSPNDPEVQNLNSLQPTVDHVSDHSRPASYHDPRSAPSRSPTVIPYPSQPSAPPAQGEVSPLDQSPNDGYFPTVPTFTSENTAPSLPTASEIDTDVPMTSPTPQDFYNSQPSLPPATLPPPSVPSQPQAPTPRPAPSPSFQTRAPPPPAPQPFVPPPQQTFHQQPQASYQAQPQASYESQAATGQYKTDDEAVLAAQKHAKWAISALNFEDSDTAVKELRLALQALGAR